MQILQNELEPEHGADSVEQPSLRSLSANQTAAHAEEIRKLRQRIALLESELASQRVANASPQQRPTPPLTSIDFKRPTPKVVATPSEFTDSSSPAVVAVTVAASGAAPSEVVASNPGFAQAWSAEGHDLTFEERIAEKAFFQGTSIDDESRSWLLDN